MTELTQEDRKRIYDYCGFEPEYHCYLDDMDECKHKFPTLEHCLVCPNNRMRYRKLDANDAERAVKVMVGNDDFVDFYKYFKNNFFSDRTDLKIAYLYDHNNFFRLLSDWLKEKEK